MGTFQIGATNDSTVYICANSIPIIAATKLGVDITGTVTCSGIFKPSNLTANRVPVMTATGLQDYAGLTYTAASFVLTSSGSTLAGFKSNATSTTGNSYLNVTNNSGHILQAAIFGTAYPNTVAGLNYAGLALLQTTRTFMMGSTTDYGVYIMNNSVIRVGITSTGMAVGALAAAGVATAAEFQVHAFMPAVTLTAYTQNSTSLMYPNGCSICADNQQTTQATTTRLSGILLRTENTDAVLQHATIGAVASAGASSYSPSVVCTIQTGASSYRTVWETFTSDTSQYLRVRGRENHAVYASTSATLEAAAGGATLYLMNTLITDSDAVEGQMSYQTFYTRNSAHTSIGSIGIASALSSSKYSPSFFFGGNTAASTWQEYAYLTGGDDARGSNFMLYAAGIYAGLSVTATLGQLRIWDVDRTSVVAALDWDASYLHTNLGVFIGMATAATTYDLNVNNGIVACQIAFPANSTPSTGGAVDWDFSDSSKFRYTNKITSDVEITITNLLANVDGTLLLQMGTTGKKVTLSRTGTTFNLIGTTSTSANSLEIPASAFHGNEYSVVRLHFAGTTTCYVHVETE